MWFSFLSLLCLSFELVASLVETREVVFYIGKVVPLAVTGVCIILILLFWAHVNNSRGVTGRLLLILYLNNRSKSH